MARIQKIKSITIENVRGIEKKFLELNLQPNRPAILVGANGFGKSSFATAFSSLRPSKLDVDKQHWHKGDEQLAPRLLVSVENDDGTTTSFAADSSANSIGEAFDIQVVGSRVVPKAHKRVISGTTIVSATVDIEPIQLVRNIPEKTKHDSTPASRASRLKCSPRLLPNISSLLEDRKLFLHLSRLDLPKSSQVKPTKVQTSVRGWLATPGTKKGSLPSATISEFTGTQPLSDIVKLIAEWDNSLTDEEQILAAIQVIDFYNADSGHFKALAKRYAYERHKEKVMAFFSSAVNPTWRGIQPDEDKAHGLVVALKKANEVSNGERDLVCIAAVMMRAEYYLDGSDCILIVDEVLDYLDDGNLIAVQYFLTKMIDRFKKQGRQLFPILLTHLDPAYFRNYQFRNPEVRYLRQCPAKGSQVRGLIVNRDRVKREDASVSLTLDQQFFHYSPSLPVDLSSDLARLSSNPKMSSLSSSQALAKSDDFEAHTMGQLELYCRQTGSYDPLAVCCAIRLKVEKWLFSKVPSNHHPALLSTYGTREKLDLAAETMGVDVPEVFYLLGVLYNEALHLKDHQDANSAIEAKLCNGTIRRMIDEAMKLAP